MARSEPDPPLDSNVYLIVEGSTAALVDAGAGRDSHRILDEIAATGVSRIAFIALTHKHADHSGGAARLAARVYAPAAIVTALASAEEDAARPRCARADRRWRPHPAGLGGTRRATPATSDHVATTHLGHDDGAEPTECRGHRGVNHDTACPQNARRWSAAVTLAGPRSGRRRSPFHGRA